MPGSVMLVVNYWPEVAAERISFLKERSGNVYENKGRLWKTRVVTGMFMKTQVVSSVRRNIIENKAT